MKIIQKLKKNNILKKIIEILSNKRYRAIIILIFWFFFFLIVTLIIRSTNKYQTPIKQELTVLEILENIDNYNFTYEVVNNDETYSINGSYINNETVLNIDDKKYFIKDKIYLIENEKLKETNNLFELNFYNLNIQNIYDLIKDEEILYETKQEEIKSTVYKVSMNEFSKIIGKELNSNDTIEITVETKDNEYNSIYIDLTKYMNYDELKYKNYSIKINLDSINEITQTSYSSLIEGE